jgi:membrane protein YdbS with pleckstrin-like domain
MNQEEKPPNSVEIGDDAIIVTQTNWAWIWATVPWIILFGVSFIFDALTFGILPIVLATAVIVPRYVAFKRTCYILTETHVVLVQGSLMGKRRVDLAFSEMERVDLRPGPFGNSLGYAKVDIQLKNGQIASLHHVPNESPLFGHIEARVTSTNSESSE